jgi:hypothetical protein
MTKYETPRLTALTPAINAIQGTQGSKQDTNVSDTPGDKEGIGAYADWE